MKQLELAAEIEALIDERMAQNGTVAMDWIVHETIERHPKIAGEDSEFYRLCGYSHVRFTAREVLRGRKSAEERNEPTQAELLPGMKHLQRSYVVERNGDAQVVRLEEMTFDELQEKEHALRAFAHGAIKHADELADYRKAREAKNTQGVA